jgi:hypothetical protein
MNDDDVCAGDVEAGEPSRSNTSALNRHKALGRFAVYTAPAWLALLTSETSALAS